MNNFIKKTLILLIFFTTPHAASAATYYVSNTGNDSNPGTITSPWKTISKAASAIVAGDTAFIRGGTYPESVLMGKNGSTSLIITISGYPGETAVIDGQNHDYGGWYGPLVQLNGSYNVISNLEIKNSYGMGLLLRGPHNRASKIYSHHHMENGILISGDYGLVEDSIVAFNCLSNINESRTRDGYWASGLTAARDPIDGHTDNAVIRRNKVYETWGEGLSSYEATGTLIEDNEVYNNYSTNIYISDTTNALIQRNLVYETTDAGVYAGDHVGIMMGDEKQLPASRGNTIINNMVYGTNRNFYWWRNSFTVDGMINDLIANNTFVNSTGSTANVIIAQSDDHSNTKFINNIMVQDNSLSNGMIAANITVSNNLWSKTPSFGNSTNDIIANPLLAHTGSTGAGLLTGEFFKLTSGSPAINKGLTVSSLTDDYFKTNRPQSTAFDIGAHEYVNQISPTPTIKPGDANNDGVVNAADMIKWLNGYIKNLSGLTNGDFDGFGNINGKDYQIWINNYLK